MDADHPSNGVLFPRRITTPPWPRLQPCTTNDGSGGVAAWRQIGVTRRQPAWVRPAEQGPTGRPRSRVQWQRSPQLPSCPWPSAADTARTGVPGLSRQSHEHAPADRPDGADDARRSQPDGDKFTQLQSRLYGHVCSPSWLSRRAGVSRLSSAPMAPGRGRPSIAADDQTAADHPSRPPGWSRSGTRPRVKLGRPL